jgi:hemerythrin-like domain-containing protein
MTVHELLTADHAQLRQQIAEIQNTLTTQPTKLEAIYLAFQEHVRVHFHKEDSVYYKHVDTGKQFADRDLMHSLRNDHAAVVFSMESLAIRLRRKVPLEEWTTRFDSMIKVLLEHFTIEETKLFPQVERSLPPDKLQTILEEIQALG